MNKKELTNNSVEYIKMGFQHLIHPEPTKAKTDKLSTGLIMIPFLSLYRVGAIFIEGLRYGRENWKKGVNDPEYQEERLEHAINHLIQWKEGNREEDHLAKVAWFCLTQMELERLESLHKSVSNDSANWMNTGNTHDPL